MSQREPREAPAPLADLLGALARRRGWQRRLEGAKVHERWDEIAGATLAAHAAPVRLHGGVLVLQVATPAWATQVRYLIPEIRRRANDVLGPGQVEQVVVTIARSGR